MELLGKKILLGVTGGIAAYKAAELTRLLQKQGATVQVAMTEAATHFVGAVTFQALSGQPVFTDQWDARMANNMAHIDLSREADAVLVAPASADFLAKVAHGQADDLLTTLVLARDCPLLVAPAMNRQMWENPATQRNAATLAADGITLLGPACGDQACGEVGAGRMLEPAEIVEDLIAFFQAKPLAGKRVLLTAGPTFEALDPVRGITNLSSGKMGYALARACAQAGAAVTLVSGPTGLACPRGVLRVEVSAALEMQREVLARAGESDVFIGVAAVADYRPAAPSAQKIKKNAAAMTVELVKNPDILAEVAALPRPPFCVGFAAESHDLATYAEGKRINKKLPLVVGNLISDGFGGEDNTVVLFDAAGAHPLATASKTEVARSIVAAIAARLPN
ncbi:MULTISPECIES: bifunctional phosphopantothenoylcysteine decarboxylase/phosphopantothenate--cysteine ligase CoaBC [Azospira]|uniref:bifunctional phosphopantothenoylcysteine decarboxylase/phosphopantothenate--cysteine ligase CoaBC n=1 Tax=Azospira TaxID=146937 RepID=UPI001964D474|nr:MULTISPECIES: bifunctional phosphopantothenoylcysteine decarboxylase/phosphopantothenate--cysteine ligase CoaBC [Azospira]MDK9690653.1 bifunctional phosphopantothenoylcysteine decarboxylase/phosphopantothenate--cysteine ligase CoaBC [Azospira sp.]